MDEFRKSLSFSRRERVAVIALLAAIVLLVLACVFHRPRVSLDEASLHDLDSLWALRNAAVEEQRHEAKEQTAERVTPLPAVASNKKPRQTYHPQEKTAWEPPVIPVVDLNTVDSAALVTLPQIGPWSAVRIIEYRDKLGGYVDLNQLREVKGMDSARFAIATPYMVINETEPRKIDVNRDDFKTLVHHPYLSYEQVKCIFRQREGKGMIKSWPQLESLIREAGDVNPLLERYVRY